MAVNVNYIQVKINRGNYGSKIDLYTKTIIMKSKNLLKWIIAGVLIIISSTLTKSYSQTQGRTRHLPDGTIVYSDGTIKRTDGTLKYPDGRVEQIDGSIKYPDGTIHYPGNNNKKKQLLPPGQAKKIYGEKSAKPFAPGQQKDKFDKEKGKGKNK